MIVMLTALSEGGQMKCHRYWQPGKYGTLQLKMLAEKQIPLEAGGSNYTSSSPSPRARRPSIGLRRSTNPHTAAEKKNVAQPSKDSSGETPHIQLRHFALSDTSSPFQPIREITQLQYSHWPDFGTPAHPAHILQLVEQSDRANVAISSPGSDFNPENPASEKERPVLVHCSAGCGRTGTFCTVDSVVDMLKRQRLGQPLSSVPGADVDPDRIQELDLIAKTVEDFRLQRLSMVQSLRQYVLCYESVLEWFVSQAQSPPVIPRSRLHALKQGESRRSYHG